MVMHGPVGADENQRRRHCACGKTREPRWWGVVGLTLLVTAFKFAFSRTKSKRSREPAWGFVFPMLAEGIDGVCLNCRHQMSAKLSSSPSRTDGHAHQSSSSGVPDGLDPRGIRLFIDDRFGKSRRLWLKIGLAWCALIGICWRGYSTRLSLFRQSGG